MKIEQYFTCTAAGKYDKKVFFFSKIANIYLLETLVHDLA